uniref:Uncharacterized protein n=1 Tax=Anguilla anguilla TaxID=7936 RepID=A0A0E9XDN1_ANGAN
MVRKTKNIQRAKILWAKTPCY